MGCGTPQCYRKRLQEVELNVCNMKCEFIEQLTEKKLSDFKALNSMNMDCFSVRFRHKDKDWKG